VSAVTDIASAPTRSPSTPTPRAPDLVAWSALAALGSVAVVLAVTAMLVLAGDDLLTGADGVRLGLAVAFSVAGAALVRRPITRMLGLVTLAGVTTAGIEFVAAAYTRRFDDVLLAEVAESLAACLVVALALHLLLILPDGRLATTTARVLLWSGYGAAVTVGLVRWGQQPDPGPWLVVVLAVALGVAGLGVANRRYGTAIGTPRHRMQWLGLALALWTEIALIVAALRLLIDWPPHPQETVAGSLALVAAALLAAASPRLLGRVDRLLSHAVSIAGLSAVVTVIYLVIVVGLGRVPAGDEQTILVLSMAAAGVSALVYAPARDRLAQAAERVVYGAERDPAEALDTFGGRLTRALPMDELLLQLAELCKKHLALRSAEVWTGVDGHLARAASVPDLGPGSLWLRPEELSVVTRGRTSGRSWAEVWLPQLIDGQSSGPLRVVPMAHQGELFGLLVLERGEGEDEFSDEDDRVLTELARQVALALHNSELDHALQASLEEVQRTNVELQASRARIVSAADLERRKLERNLHDGAQQHLVALAVKLRLVQRLGEGDPAAALAMVEEVRADALATIEELRTLAHGIYPPVLMDKGLPAALSSAADRASLPVTVTVTGVERYPQELEAAMYFCCLEALQNAGKHAGDGATVDIHLTHAKGELRFTVTDDGVGFDASTGGGHGFVNMADRLGALGGTLEVISTPFGGTRVEGRIPVADRATG
jgi:signal transduction histidine kinase